MGNEKEVKEIRIEKSYNIEKEGLYLIIAILAFFIVFIIILVFGFIYLTEPDVLLSPPSISLFLMGLNDSYEVVIGDEASVEERDLISGFILGFEDLIVLKESEYSDEKGLVIMGVVQSFENVPYLEYLEDNDSVVIYNNEEDSLYIYSKDLDSLRVLLDILKSDSENLEYFSIKVNEGVVEELVI